MKFEKSLLDDHQAELVVRADPAELERAMQSAARKLAARGKIAGFRPGKIPYDVIVRTYGESAVREQALDVLVDDLYPRLLKEAEIEPAAPGTLQAVDDAAEPKFTFRIPLAPTVQLGDYKSIRLPYEFIPPVESKVEDAIQELRRSFASTEAIDRPAEVGDYVLVGVASEIAALTRDSLAVTIADPAPAGELPFPGFSASLLGLRAGDQKTVAHQFPQGETNSDIAGKAVELAVTIKAVRRIILPAVDDTFAGMVGTYKSLAELRNAVATDVEARAKAEYDDDYFMRLLQLVKDASTLKYAPQTIAHEAEHVIEDLSRRLADQGLDLATYYKMRNTDAQRFTEEEAKPVAIKRLERSLILEEVARNEKIQIDNAALDEEFRNSLSDLQMQGLNLGKLKGGRQGQQRVAEAVAMQSANRLMTRRTLDRLRTYAVGQQPEDSSTAPAPAAPENNI